MQAEIPAKANYPEGMGWIALTAIIDLSGSEILRRNKNSSSNLLKTTKG
jgi:hypothetical protein